MPFSSPFDSRGSSSRGSVFDRFGPRKNSVYERPSTYGSSTTATNAPKYRSSTLERSGEAAGPFGSTRYGSGASGSGSGGYGGASTLAKNVVAAVTQPVTVLKFGR